MMPPGEFMLYATPVILLISQEVRAYLVRRDMRRMTEAQTESINVAGNARAKILQSTTLDTASKLAIHTSEKAIDLKTEIGEIHEIVNGNTTALKDRIKELESQLASANHHT